jgi:hypothetical protein
MWIPLIIATLLIIAYPILMLFTLINGFGLTIHSWHWLIFGSLGVSICHYILNKILGEP